MTVPARWSVDLNADMGEGFGRYALDDGALLSVVTSASVACGFHAGDPLVMRATATNATRHGVVIGAHPGYPDLVGFGRRDLGATPAEIEAMVIYQTGAMAAMCAAAGTTLRYVKPHGALYNRAARDAAAAGAIARAVRLVDPSLVLLGLAGSELVAAAARAGVRAATEGFVDRAYASDGTLVPRSEPGAVLSDVAAVARRAVQMVKSGSVEAIDGTTIELHVDSLCTHGDGANAVEMVRAVRAALENEDVRIAPFARD